MMVMATRTVCLDQDMATSDDGDLCSFEDENAVDEARQADQLGRSSAAQIVDHETVDGLDQAISSASFSDRAESSSLKEGDNGKSERSSRRALVHEMQEFVEDMKRKRGMRLRMLEEKGKISPREAQKIEEGLMKIEKLDLKLKELEEKLGSDVGSSAPDAGSTDASSMTVKKLRSERKERRRLLKLRRSLENLDCLQDKRDHVLRNIVLGPNARYFTLTADEEAAVEELLQQPDFIDDDFDSKSITSSHVSTAFDVEGEEAVRLAEIESRLGDSHAHSYCSASPMASGPCIDSRAPTPAADLSRQHEAVTRALAPFVTTTAVEDYLAELKDRREYEEKLEIIDKKLRQLQTSQPSAPISEEQVMQLVNECRKEPVFDAMNRSYTSSEDKASSLKLSGTFSTLS